MRASGLAMPAEGGTSIGRQFASGFDGCTADHLGFADGALVSRLTSTSTSELSFTMTMPEDVFGAAIGLDVQDIEIRRGRRTSISGRLPKGHMFIQRPGQTTGATTLGCWSTLFVRLPRSVIGRICQAAELDVDPAQIEFRDPAPGHEAQTLDFARRAAREIDGTDAFARLRVDLITQALVIDMLSNHSSINDELRPTRPSRGGLAPLQLRRACDAMDGMLESEVTLAALARAAGCSPTHFSRAFKQSTGMPPFAWLLHRRVERAQDLLRMGDLPVAEVALAVGFSAQPQFTTAFKRVTGTTPAAWRRNLR